MYRIAIQPDDQLLTSGRRQSFSSRWAELGRAAGHEVRLVDAYGPGFFRQLEGCDGFLWWFAHLPSPRLFARRLLPAVEHGSGIHVFPSWRTVWHFDDKVAQHYLLQSAGVPMPRSWVLWDERSARAFCSQASYPLVLKLAGGITSENVRLVENAKEAQYWVDRMFGPGVTHLGERLPWETGSARRMLGRARRALRAFTGRPVTPISLRNETQRGYLLLQAFLPGNDFDTRVTVIGNRAFAYRRFNRPDDFRASGSGLRDADPAAIDLAAVRLALRIASNLGTQSLAVDVLRARDGELMITEISYYYEGWILHEEGPGHWVLHGDPGTGELAWVEARLRPEDAIWDDFVSALARTPRSRSLPAQPNTHQAEPHRAP